MIWLILIVLLMCAALVACVFEGAIRAEVYPSEAADAPTNPLLDPDWPRAKNFIEEEAVELQATAQAPVVVAGSDLSDARVNLIFAVQVMPYAEDAKQYAAGLLGLYVVPEVER